MTDVPPPAPNRGKPRQAPIIDAEAHEVAPDVAAPDITEPDVAKPDIASAEIPAEKPAESFGADEASTLHVTHASAQTGIPTEPETPIASEPVAEIVRQSESLPDHEPPPHAPEGATHADPAVAPATKTSVLPIAALACSLLALAGTGWLATRSQTASTTDADLRARISALEAKIAPLEAATKTFNDAQAQINDLGSSLKSSFDAARQALTSAPAPAAPTAPLVPPQPIPVQAPMPPPVDLTPLTSRLSELEQKVVAATQKLTALDAQPKLDVAATDRKTASALASADAAASIVLAQALVRAVDSGRPFTQELNALVATGTSAERVKGLRETAATGVATSQSLADSFMPLAGPILAGADTKPTGSLLDRLTQGAASLVKIRPAGDSSGDGPLAVIGRIEAALARGDVPAALNARAQLPGPAKATTEAWAAKAQARVDAMALAGDIAADATRRLGQAKP